MVDDSPDFQPWNGTETPWGFNGHEESDTTYHRVPGPALRYWFVDKRRFWILDGDEENDLRTSEWWWIVEKPWELLSEATKAELNAESDRKRMEAPVGWWSVLRSDTVLGFKLLRGPAL
jgi:hypothetical protein